MTWRIWQWQRALARTTRALTIAERNTHLVLHNAPAVILQGQDGIQHLRTQYQQVSVWLQQIKQILALLGLGRFAWQLYGKRGQAVRWETGKSSRTKTHA